MKRFLPLVLFSAMVIVFAAMLLDGDRNPAEINSVFIGQPAPAFDLKGLRSQDGRLSQTHLADGQVKIVNFFASWCVPCRAEHPALMALAERSDIQVYGIAYKDAERDSRAFLSELGDPFDKIGVDLNGRVGIEWGVTGVPETFIVDGAGVIRYRHLGPIIGDSLESRLLPELKNITRANHETQSGKKD